MSVTRRWGVRAAALIAASVLASGMVVPAASATPGLAHATPEQSTSLAGGLSDTAELVIAPTVQVFDDPGRDIEFHVLLRNSGSRALPEGSIELALEPKVTERQPDGWVTSLAGPEGEGEGEVPAPTATVIATETVGSTEAETEQTLTVTVPASSFPLTELSEAGVYTVTANYLAADAGVDDPLAASTPIVWRGVDRDTTPVKLSVVVPFVLPAEITTMPTRTQLGDLTPGFDTLLDFANDTHAILAIDPRIIAAIRGYGTEAPEGARAFLERLEASPLTSFLLQYADADLTPQAALGLPTPLHPVNLDFVTRLGKFEADPAANGEEVPSDGAAAGSSSGEGDPSAETPGDVPADDAAQSDEPTDAPAGSGEGADSAITATPTLEELGAWEHGVAGAWPSQVTSRTLSYLEGAGFTFTVLSSDNATLHGGPRATLGAGDALVTDAELDDAVRLALSATTQAERELGLARANARLLDAAETGVTGLGLAIDRGALITKQSPTELLDPIVNAQWVRTVGLSAQSAGTATLNAATLDAHRVELLDDALRSEPEVLEVRSMLEHPEYLDGYQRMRLLTLFSTRHADDDAAFAKAAKRFERRSAEIRGGVSVVVSKHAQLVGASSRIPVQLRNSLPFDVVANVAITPTSAALAVEQRTFPEVRVTNDSNDRILVPVASRVSSGESGLHILVTSTDGEFTAASDVLNISISTRIETIALALLGLAAVLLFGFGIWRSVRRRRTGIARI